jgi:acetyl esterase/lipase
LFIVFKLIRAGIKQDYHLIIHEFDKSLEVYYRPRRNNYNNDLHFRIMTNLDLKFNIKRRFIPKKIDRAPNGCSNIFGLLVNIVKDKYIPEYDVVFYLHGGGFLANTSEGHSDYLRK